MSQPNQNVVSWQSAFWGIALVALNSITQEHGGRVCGYDRRLRAGFLTSPFCSLAHSLIVVFELCSEYYNSGSFRKSIIKAANKMELFHRRDFPSSNGRRSRVYRGKGNLQWFFLHVAVPIAAILQCVKLLACRGLPWTQAFAVFYILAFGTDEMLLWFGQPHTPSLGSDSTSEANDLSSYAHNPNDVDDAKLLRIQCRFRDCVVVAALLLQCTSWYWILVQVFDAVIQNGFPKECKDAIIRAHEPVGILKALFFIFVGFPSWIIWYCLFYVVFFINIGVVLGILAMPFQAFFVDKETLWLTIIVTGIFATIVFLIAWVFPLVRFTVFFDKFLVSSYLDWLVEHFGTQTACNPYTPATVFLVLCLPLLLALTLNAMESSDLRKTEQQNRALTFTMTVVNIGLALVYYTVAYKSEHTTKPRWVENLG